jgi:hypothetical protein
MRKISLCTASIICLSVLISGCGGSSSGADVQANTPTNSGPVRYSGPVPANGDVAAFQLHLWSNVVDSERCGACHGAGGQSPAFARADNINLAYASANTIVSLSNPANSTMVSKVAGGHNCWLESDAACADLLATWIENWANASLDGDAQALELVPPTDREPGSTRAFPATSSLFDTEVYQPILEPFCTECHSSASGTPITPYFADPDVDAAYLAAQPVINLDSPGSSRVVQRLSEDQHNCWTDDCDADAAALAAAIARMANGIPLTPPSDDLVISRALRLEDGIPASSGGRYQTNEIARYEFRAGTGSTVFDRSGLEPAINLTLSGDTEWVGGWGIRFSGGKAQATTQSSAKLASMIAASGEFSLEAWVVPATPAQDMANIVSYSAGADSRNVTLSQNGATYEAALRHEGTDGNGMPVLASPADSLQSTLQHVVVTYDVEDGRRIYINGQDTGVVDPVAPDLLTSWNANHALIFGNEGSNDRPWGGVLRFVAFHNRALTPAQIDTNFAAGVGERFYMLFGIGDVIGLDDSYIGFLVSRFDNYGYLFAEPFFINLDENITTPPSIPLRGMRLGINGREVTTAQVWSELNTTIGGASYDTAGQPISPLGTILAVDNGPDQDEFFLSFEQLASDTNVFAEPASTPLVVAPAPERPDVGLRTFDEINASMSALTGVARTQTDVADTFQRIRQQLPAEENAAGFLTSHQIGIAQLAIEYCNALVDTEYADTPTSSSYFNGLDYTEDANAISDADWRSLVIDTLVERMIGAGLESQPLPADASAELESLLLSLDDNKPEGATDGQPDGLARCGGSCPATQTRTAVKAACAATLGSATMLLQ